MKTVYIVLLVVLGIVILLGISFYVFYRSILWRIHHYPKDNPFNYLKRNAGSIKSKKRIVFIGDSLTHGNMSVNYIDMISKKLGMKNYDYINAGMNSELAYNVLLRIESIIACESDFITIMIGSNDAHREIELFNEQSSEKRLNLPRKASKEWFGENLEKIVQELQQKTDAKIALCSIPPLGEDQSALVFKQTIAFSKLIQDIAKKFKVQYLPVNEKMIDFLNQNPSEPKYGANHRLVEEIATKHFLLRKSFDTLSEEYGFSLFTDNLHLNSKGANIVSELVIEFVQKN